jgi:hypothetical protein
LFSGFLRFVATLGCGQEVVELQVISVEIVKLRSGLGLVY